MKMKFQVILRGPLVPFILSVNIAGLNPDTIAGDCDYKVNIESIKIFDLQTLIYINKIF